MTWTLYAPQDDDDRREAIDDVLDFAAKLDDIEANLAEAQRLKRLMETVIGIETAIIIWLLLQRL